MRFDLKTPIGLLFSLYGLLLVLYAIFGEETQYARSLGWNVNGYWGALMLSFGIGLLVLGRRHP
jgi:hypothetical protein